MISGRKFAVGVCLLVGCSSSGSGAGSGAANGGSSGNGAGGGATSGGATSGGGGSSAVGGSPGHAGGPSVMPPYISDPSASFPSQLTLAGGYLYWLSGTHQIARAPADASQPAAVIFTHAGTSRSIVAIGGIAVGADALYFTDEGDGAATERGVYQLALDGSGTPTKLTDGAQPAAIALDGDTLCFTDGSDLRQVKTNGQSAITLLHGGVDYRTGLLVSQGFVYFPAAFGADAQDLYRLPLGMADPAAAGSSGGSGGSASGGASGVSGASGTSGAGGASGTAGAGGAANNGAQKVSTVPGRYDILLASRVDNGDIYWGVEETIYKWSGSAGGASSVAVVTDPLDEQATAPPHSVLVPFDGTLYWVGGDEITSSTIFEQALPNGTRTVVAPVSASSLALDTQYVYAGVSNGINRYAH